MKQRPQNEIKEIKSLADLTQDDKNANKGTVRGEAMLDASVNEHGAAEAVVVDKSGKIIGGNKRTKSFIKAGLNDPIVVQSDGSRPVVIQRTDLDMDKDPEARELGVMLNRSGEVSLSWDAQTLQRLEAGGVDLSKAFDPTELSSIIALSEANAAAAANSVAAPPDFPAFDETLSVEHRCPKCGYEWSGKTK